MAQSWHGVFPAVTTQLKKDQSLDLDGTARHLEVLIDSGVNGLVLLGSLGENQTLDPEEKRRVMRAAIETARGRVPVLSGVAEPSTSLAIRYARDLEDLGADGLM
jgi:dihydrodipicolinate synthase/N-acetylneuraminate lyase